jgi:hypothetical protein
MPRTSRTVAQRLAAQKPRKRRAPRPAVAPSVAEILAEAAPEPSVDAQTALPVRPAESAAVRRGGGVGSASRPVARRRYADYAAEYRYVWGDLRRIALVAGGLLLLLIILSLFVG